MNMLWTLPLLLGGCHSETPAGVIPENPPTAGSAGTKISVEFSEAEREPSDEEIREFGRITAIEDGTYPFFR